MSESSNNQNTNQNQDYNWELEQQVNTENMNEDELRRRKQALENGNDPMDDNLSNHEENDMETDKDGRTWITVSRAIRRYKASINIKHISGNNWKQKMDTVQNKLVILMNLSVFDLSMWVKNNILRLNLKIKR